MSDEAWTDSEVAAVERAEEVSLVIRRNDGTQRALVTIWIGESDGRVYVRFGNGVGGFWYRRATGRGQLNATGLSANVALKSVTDSSTVTAGSVAYQHKYGRYEKIYRQPIVMPLSESATLKLSPVRESVAAPE